MAALVEGMCCAGLYSSSASFGGWMGIRQLCGRGSQPGMDLHQAITSRKTPFFAMIFAELWLSGFV